MPAVEAMGFADEKGFAARVFGLLLPRCAVWPRILAAFQEAEPYLLPAHAFKLVSWLVSMTMPGR
jgi:hypothetical protein